MFKEDFGAYCTFIQSQLDEQMAKCVTPDGLEKLNFNLGIKQGCQAVLNLLEDYKNEIQEKSANQA